MGGSCASELTESYLDLLNLIGESTTAGGVSYPDPLVGVLADGARAGGSGVPRAVGGEGGRANTGAVVSDPLL